MGYYWLTMWVPCAALCPSHMVLGSGSIGSYGDHVFIVRATVRPCVRVCLFVRELLPQFSFFLHQTWHTELWYIVLEIYRLGFFKKSLFLKLLWKNLYELFDWSIF